MDGREKEVDTYYFNKQFGKDPAQRLPLMYWGKYVQHDNNRDGMGQYLKLTQNFMKGILDWHPTILHDLHEAQSYLYISTGTGPYNDSLDPIQINEWWLLAQTETMEMAKRGVPGVFTYGYYDGWTPNYLFWMAITHNSFGRFYEVQSYGPDIVENLRLSPTATSREWFRPNPPLPSIKWGPRNNTNIQESALLIALNKVAQDKTLYLENYYLKNKRAIDKGKEGPNFGWLIPATQRRAADAADFVNALRKQGVEVHKAASGDYIIRGDQPYRTLADMYLSVQNYPPANPRPYDDTGWTMQYMRNVKVSVLTDKAALDQPMALLTADAKPAGGTDGTGTTLIVEHTTDNALMAFRYRNKDVKMLAAEEDFDLNGRSLRAGSFIIPNIPEDDRAKLDSSLRDLGLRATAIPAPPAVKTHELNLPRIGYVHSWSRTQDEGWVRAALDYYSVPYTYFADQKLREGNLRAKYDVIIFPHVGGTSQSMLAGIPKTGDKPMPYKKSALTPNLGAVDESDDIRGGMGLEGMVELTNFVSQGGTLITEGSTASLMAEFNPASGVNVEHPARLFARGSILRGTFTDMKSPIAYGYNEKDLPVYFNQDPVLNAALATAGGAAQGAAEGQNITPNVTGLAMSPFESTQALPPSPVLGGAGPVTPVPAVPLPQTETTIRPRIVMQFPAKATDILLSGTLAGAETLVNRTLIADINLGKGHIVMFALRPFWRWQSQGSYFLAFNAILNWDDLDSGKTSH